MKHHLIEGSQSYFQIIWIHMETKIMKGFTNVLLGGYIVIKQVKKEDLDSKSRDDGEAEAE